MQSLHHQDALLALFHICSFLAATEASTNTPMVPTWPCSYISPYSPIVRVFWPFLAPPPPAKSNFMSFPAKQILYHCKGFWVHYVAFFAPPPSRRRPYVSPMVPIYDLLALISLFTRQITRKQELSAKLVHFFYALPLLAFLGPLFGLFAPPQRPKVPERFPYGLVPLISCLAPPTNLKNRSYMQVLFILFHSLQL